MKFKEYWRRYRNQLSQSQVDVILVFLFSTTGYLIAIYVDLAELVSEKLAKYEYFQLDEFPFLLLLVAFGLVWYSRRRILALNQEMMFRTNAEAETTRLLLENKALVQHVLKVQEAERLQLARDLHDDIGQYLLAIRLDASSLNFIPLDKEGCEIQQLHARRILANAHHIQAMTKTLMTRLRPAPVNSKCCAEAIRQLIQDWHEHQPQIRLTVNIESLPANLAEQISITAYRLVQEALTNVSKHAKAKSVAVSMMIVTGGLNGLIKIEIQDDGLGFDRNLIMHSMGLTGMRERIDSVNGELSIMSAINQGVTIVARIYI